MVLTCIEVITWSTTRSTGTYQFANVQVHYVTEKGLEIADPTSVPASSLGDGTTKADGTAGSDNIIKLSDWALDDDNSRVDGYDYVEARIGDKDGRVITGLKGVKNSSGGKDTYALYYTTVSEPSTATDDDWTQYKDSVSNTADNNASVYLLFKTMSTPITFYFIDRQGKAIQDDDGNTSVTLDASTWGNSWKNGVGFGPKIFG